MRDKKGNINLIVPSVLVLVLGGIILIFGLLMLDELFMNTTDTTTSVVNESLTSVDENCESVTTTGKCGFHGFTVDKVINGSSGTVILASNYTVISNRQGKVCSTSGIFNSTNWNVTYSYIWGNNEACFATNSTIEGLGKYADYIDLIALAVVIAVVISLVMIMFTLKKQQ